MAIRIIRSQHRPLALPTSLAASSHGHAPGFGAGLYREVGFPPRREPGPTASSPFDDEQPHPSS
ncbi:hypothetical protein [Brevundimonas sp. GCM10030266]|uniref:hypothetical protein n=1 Tax=Brevundimonas sp. GCM10030266 TaxID=3273386 RepID=UPI003622F56C